MEDNKKNFEIRKMKEGNTEKVEIVYKNKNAANKLRNKKDE